MLQPLTGGRMWQGAHGDGAALRGHEGEQVAQAFPGDRDPRHWVRGGMYGTNMGDAAPAPRTGRMGVTGLHRAAGGGGRRYRLGIGQRREGRSLRSTRFFSLVFLLPPCLRGSGHPSACALEWAAGARDIATA